ncbi:30S ribosomal protein S6--L-glutamate ligase [Xanthovirga aplysinae]|uniref:30S ribosomal protein S6--L-glutamate ligase n=1 Tax=Xanthovirga aplysinae TaxID=2529853 RepID=UPI0012BB80C8|nr:30S ribosomal protein S6--L-glutamate ligase [Xanthovirga aplysinae]MTI32425.1 30S ribosomal protein S6--L-glutamate ligase [Xanthovirga aplysinae]
MNIGILSRNPELYSTKRLVEACELRNHTIQIIDHSKCDLVMEKKQPQVLYHGEYLNDFDAIIPRIGASVTFFGSAVIRQFEMMKTFSVTDSQALLRSRDKLRSLQLLAREGLGMPKTVFTNYSKHTDEIIDSVGGAPLVIKFLEGTQGIGVVLAENKKAAESVLAAFNGLKARVIVQEFIKECKGTDIRAFVVDGEVVGAMRRKAQPGEFRSNLHLGATAEIVTLTRSQKSAALKAAKAMGLHVAGVDMLPSSKGPLILEVNSSPGLQGIETSTGVDIAGKIIEFIERNARKRRKKISA